MLTITQKNHARRWIVLWIAYWCFAFLLTHLPPDRIGELPFPGADKLVHFGLYFVLTWIGGCFLRAIRGRFTSSSALAWFALLAVYGVVDEWSQRYVGRTPSVLDWFADVAGVTAGLGWHWWRCAIQRAATA